MPISLFLLSAPCILLPECKICTMMTEESSEQSRFQFYIYIYRVLLPLLPLLPLLLRCVLLYCCCCSSSTAASCCCCNRVPDGQIWCWFIESEPSVFFLFIQTRFIFMYPLAVLRRIYGFDLPTSLVIAGMRGANAGVSRGEAPLFRYGST